MKEVKLTKPTVILFDWHATLVDTLDAMYHAVDDMLPKLEELGLLEKLVTEEDSKTIDDAKLVKYVQREKQLHPKIKRDRKISRTDIFEVLFGSDREAKHIAHRAFNECYRDHYGEVHPFEEGEREMLEQVRSLGIQTGVLTNRDREFLEHELAIIDGTGWTHLFDTIVCGGDVAHRKPAPDPIFLALENLGVTVGAEVWYVGDSTTDTVSAKEAGITSIFFNGAGWTDEWIEKIFPDTALHPHKPDQVVQNFKEFKELVNSLYGV